MPVSMAWRHRTNIDSHQLVSMPPSPFLDKALCDRVDGKYWSGFQSGRASIVAVGLCWAENQMHHLSLHPRWSSRAGRLPADQASTRLPADGRADDLDGGHEGQGRTWSSKARSWIGHHLPENRWRAARVIIGCPSHESGSQQPQETAGPATIASASLCGSWVRAGHGACPLRLVARYRQSGTLIDVNSRAARESY